VQFSGVETASAGSAIVARIVYATSKRPPREHGVHAKVHTVAICPSSLCILASLHNVRTAVIGVTL